MITAMSRWLVFFGPKRFAAYVKGDSSIIEPLILVSLMSLLNSKVYSALGWEEFSLNAHDTYYILFGTLGPMVLAITYDGLAKIILHVHGSLSRMIRLFYYASVGAELCSILLGTLLMLLPNRVLGLTGSMILSLYWLLVSLKIVKENYSFALGKAVMLTLLVILLAITISLLTFLLWDLIL